MYTRTYPDNWAETVPHLFWQAHTVTQKCIVKNVRQEYVEPRHAYGSRQGLDWKKVGTIPSNERYAYYNLVSRRVAQIHTKRGRWTNAREKCWIAYLTSKHRGAPDKPKYDRRYPKFSPLPKRSWVYSQPQLDSQKLQVGNARSVFSLSRVINSHIQNTTTYDHGVTGKHKDKLLDARYWYGEDVHKVFRKVEV